VKVSPNVALTIGSKFEHNDYTGFEFEPSAQLVWTPREKQTWWASASKAIQQPSWYFANSITDAFTFPMQGGVFGLYQILGNPTGQAAQLYDYEIGYRNEISSRLTLDVTSFVSDYRRLQTLEPLTAYFTRSAGPPYLVLPNIWENLGRGLDYGLEFSGNLRLTDWWRISPGFSFLQMHSSLKPGSQDTSLAALLGDSPKHEGQIRSTMNLPHHLEWDVFGAYVGALRIGPVPSYTRLDTRLGWRAGEHLEFSLSGQNLLTPHHVEFLDALQVVPTEASRSIFAKVTWRF
jgi:iron complex outermembrane receptor protein